MRTRSVTTMGRDGRRRRGRHSVGGVRHATTEALDRLEPLLAELRSLPGLVEKKRGVFYRRSKAFVHFHEDLSGLYADVRFAGDFERMCVETAEQRAALVSRVAGW